MTMEKLQEGPQPAAGAMNRLEGLFRPKNLAVVGASETSHYASSIMQNLLRFGYPAQCIFPVNPKYPAIYGNRCYPRVSDIPGDLDLAVIVVGRDHVLPVLEESIAKKVKAALIVSTGFAESDERGRRLQSEVADLARRHSVALCGPNTLGYFSSEGGVALWSALLPKLLSPGPIGALFHSSGLLNLFLNVAAERCLGFRYAIACGNEADLGMADYLEAMLDDPGVKVIATLIETVRQPEKLRCLLDVARERGIPVVALRVGRSIKGSRAIASHTGNMATSGAAWQSLFRQKGVVSVDTMDQMIETAIAFSSHVRPQQPSSSGGVGIVTISGGDCSFLSDICERVDLALPEPSPETYRALSPYFAKERFHGNPLDVEDLHQVDESRFYDCLKAFSTEKAFDLVCCRLSLPKTPDERLKRLYARSASVVQETGKSVVFLSRASEPLDRSWFEFFSQLGVPFLMEYEKGLRAVREVLWLASRPRPSTTQVREFKPARPSIAGELKTLLATEKEAVLSFHATRRLLSAYEIPLAEESLAHSSGEAVRAARAMGFPVVMKVISPDLPHKTEIGALLANLANEAEVEEAYQTLEKRVRERAHEAKIEGILVQKMVQGIGEIIVGTSTDPQLGPVTLFGLGGIYTEILKEYSLRLPPLTTDDAREMIHEVKGSEILRGARGQASADIDAIVDILMKVSQLALDFGKELESIELNPLIALSNGNGALVVDTLLSRRISVSGNGEGR